jgi:hypothetical protein
MPTDASELLDRFKHNLPNRGTWYWTERFDGTRPRLLVAMTKMLKNGMIEEEVEDTVCDLMFASYVEHERQVKHYTGKSVEQLIAERSNETQPTSN